MSRRLPGFSSKLLQNSGDGIPAGHLVFVCNICGNRTSAELDHILARGMATCSHCHSNNRFRSLIAALTERLFDRIAPLSSFPERKDLSVLGMSDEWLYAGLLKEKFDYINTFFHTEPYLDITDPPEAFRHRFDLVVSADVMEHVPPPIDLAFRNLRSLLRPSGLLVLSVPFSHHKETLEHFPDLYRFEILGDGADRHLVNMTRLGEEQVFRNLTFHGGKGATLEMRLFSETGVLHLLENTGFKDIRLHAKNLPEWGIVHRHRFSVPITAIAA